jgi:hypothetical protein
MADLPTHASKQQLHFMALIIVRTLENFTITTFWTATSPKTSGRLLLAHLCLITWKRAEQRRNSIARSCTNIKTNKQDIWNLASNFVIYEES